MSTGKRPKVPPDPDPDPSPMPILGREEEEAKKKVRRKGRGRFATMLAGKMMTTRNKNTKDILG